MSSEVSTTAFIKFLDGQVKMDTKVKKLKNGKAKFLDSFKLASDFEVDESGVKAPKIVSFIIN